MIVDIRFCLIFIVLLLVICLLSKTNNINNTHDTETHNQISIDDKIYQKMLDAVTHYSLMSKNYDEKLILIYLATFHLFDMNYDYNNVKKLDAKLSDHPYIPNHMEYPVGNMHNNIQKVIITHISENIVDSERQLTNDKNKDREILDVYLITLFKDMGVYKY